MTMPPLPSITPEKVVEPAAPVLSVPAPKPTVPAPLRLPKRSSPPKASRAPGATVTTGKASKRLALPSVKLPVPTATVSAAAVPLRLPAPLLMSAPAPRLALAVPLSIR